LAFKNLFLPKRKNCIVLEPHMGLGDSLINIGLVKTIAGREPGSIFYYACLPMYFHSISWALSGLSNVYPLVVNSGREARQYAEFKNAAYLPIGIDNVDIHRFDEFFYSQHQVPFAMRWELAKTPAGLNSETLYKTLNPKNLPYVLVCNKDSSGESHRLNLPTNSDLLVIHVHPATKNIYDWMDLVLDAEEIHTIDTAFIHFVENTLDSNTAKRLYFHRIRKSPTEFTRRLPWREVLY
jgi:hypothetical protein